MLVLLAEVFIISLSGAMAPGPLSAVVLNRGVHDKWSGVKIGFGHILIEIPVIILIALGLGVLLNFNLLNIVLFLLGGMYLLMISTDILKEEFRDSHQIIGNKHQDSPSLKTGFLLTGVNPYFTIWWITVGAAVILISVEK